MFTNTHMHTHTHTHNNYRNPNKNVLNSIIEEQNVFILFFEVSWNVSTVGDRSRGRPGGSLFNSYYTEVLGRALLFSLNCSTLSLIRTLYRWVLNKEESSTIFKVFGMTQPGIQMEMPNIIHISSAIKNKNE